MTTRTAVDRLLAVVVGGQPGVDLVTDTSELDATCPGWRSTTTGSAILETFAQWFAPPRGVEELERHTTPTGEVVSYTVTWFEGGVPHAARHVHILTLEDDRTTRDQLWCAGGWPAPLLADMDAARR